MTSNLGIISDPEPPKKEYFYTNITVQILHNKCIFWNETTLYIMPMVFILVHVTALFWSVCTGI